MLDMSSVDIDDLLPLTPASFHIMLVLAGEPAHGYAIMQEVARMTGGAAQLGPGTLYRTIQKLLDDALIEATGHDADERRVPYKLTRHGAAVARAEARRHAMLVQIATERRLLPAGTARRGAHV
jgi:DNA-binding PadR family transcriptional regulator